MDKLKILLSASLMFTISSSVNAAEIVYPKAEIVTIDSDKTFFIGNECPDKTLKINSEIVDIHTSGGFLHPVKLEIGENIFNIDNGEDIKTYTITRPQQNSTPATAAKFINYDKEQIFLTNQDNVPLRSTPVDAGLNRLQHLESQIPLKIIGEYGEFYKVQLARDDYAWISKSHVKKTADVTDTPAKIENYTYEEFPDKRIFTIKLNKKVPYILYENSGFDLTLYNIDGYFENKYEFHINKTGKPFGYKSYYKNKNELVIEVKNFPKVDPKNPIKSLKITIDPGHGGSEVGVIGCLGDKEKDINLIIAQDLDKLLSQSGANVLMTRNEDCTVSLQDRTAMANNNNSDIFISIHNNALPDSEADSNRSGTGIYYFYPQSKELAKAIQDTMLKELELKDDKVRGKSFAVIRNTQMPAVLIEAGYLIVPEDNAKLITPEFQQKVAEAIKKGLENYLNGI